MLQLILNPISWHETEVTIVLFSMLWHISEYEMKENAVQDLISHTENWFDRWKIDIELHGQKGVSESSTLAPILVTRSD